ncbi:MAG: class I adenylate-forming enzyme family protein [Dehalococcoidia bacterium]|nr:class I adenylate-forming enzyme family protein [Dehalococcoidia bacterium]
MSRPTRYTEEMTAEYFKKGYWESTTWPEIWARNAEKWPDREALVDSKTRLTWAQANQLIDRLALKLLEMGFKKDEVLVLQLPNCIELCLLRLACEKAGILCLPVLRTLRQKEMEYILRYVDAAGWVIPWKWSDFDYFEMAQELRPRLPRLRHIFVTGEEVPSVAISVAGMLREPTGKKYAPGYLNGLGYKSTEVSWISHTTGTTGFPKFVEIPACARVALCKGFIQPWKLTSDDVIGAFSPATGGPNIIVYWGAALVGARVVLMERFEAEAALQTIEKEKVTVLGVVPTMFIMMMTHPRRKDFDLSSVRLWACPAGTPPEKLAREVEDETSGKVIQYYGAVDWGGIILSPLEASREERWLTTGKPIPHHEVKLVDNSGKEVGRGEVGELWARGPAGIAGYYKNPEATWEVWSREGWFKTGDLARIDGRGNVVIAGRKKDMIKRGGQNIYPVEIEDILIGHPKVAGVAIVGMPDPLMGERACAFVVPKAGQSFLFEEMVSFLKDKKVAAFKLPERLELADRLPTVAEGQKVDKKVLQQEIAKKLKAEGKIQWGLYT